MRCEGRGATFRDAMCWLIPEESLRVYVRFSSAPSGRDQTVIFLLEKKEERVDATQSFPVIQNAFLLF